MKKKIARYSFIIIIIIAVFLPSFSKLQEMRSKNEELEKEIVQLKEENIELEEEMYRLTHDPVYLESVAREKMNLARKGEVIYKIVPEE